MLSDLYKKGKQSEIATKSVLSTLVDASKRLNIINYSNLREFDRSCASGIFVSTDPQNSGFYYIVRYPVVSSNDYIDIYFQVKYSGQDVTTKINDECIQSCFNHCEIASNGLNHLVRIVWLERDY